MRRADGAPSRLVWTRLAAGLGALVVVVGGKAGAEALQRYRFALNETESLPNWAFVADQRLRNPRRGDLVVFRPPPTRFYPAGMAFAKIVGGVPGDHVEVHGRSFFVAGRYVGEAKRRAQDGRAAAIGPSGVIPPGHYFLYTPHKDSLDSRYAMIGWVPQARILGVAKAVM